jgi:hypothetical protein
MGPQTPAWDELETLPLEEVREFFVTLGKALRAYQLYDENNPVYQRFVQSLREAFSILWKELDHLKVHVGEDVLTFGQAEIYRAANRSDSLAFLFYKDGIREITFKPGIEEGETPRLLSVLQRARQARSEGDDLLTILWEEDLEHFDYQYVDLLAEGVEMPEAGPGHSQAELQSVLEAEVEAEGEEAGEDAADEGSPEGPKPISREDFNPTLYSLDAREMEHLRREIEIEMDRDLRGDVLAALFDRVEEADDPERQSEILGIFRQLLPNFLSRGVLEAATQVLDEIHALERTPGRLDETRMAEAKGILDEMSNPEALEELIRSLEDRSIRPEPKALAAFLRYLRASALGPLLRAAESTEDKELQPVLREAVKGIANTNRRALVNLLAEPDAVVVAGAARLVGTMQVAEAGPSLADLMYHELPAVRLAAVESASDLRASTAAGALVDVLFDPDREVRVAAARALGKLRYGPATKALADIIMGKEIRSADLTEKLAFFEGFGLLGQDGAVGLLDKQLNGKGFLGRREPSEIRACAALALGKIGTASATAALRRALSEEDPVVRSAVNRALRGEEADG